MRFLIVILATFAFVDVAVNGIDTTPKNTLEANILNLLTKWRAGDKGPFSFPLPSLEEIELPATNGNYDGFGAKITFATSELKLLGLKSFSVEELDASEPDLNASAKITLPTLTVNSDTYNINGRALWFIPVNGSGKLSIIVRNIQAKLSVRLRTNDTRTWVESLQMAFKIGSIRANLQNGPAAISTLLNNSGPQIIQGYHDDIVAVVRGQMVPVMNEFLRDMTPQQLFQTIAQNTTATAGQV